MEDFIEYEREIQLGGVPETSSDDTGRGKEIFEAMREIDESYSGKIAAGRITIQRQYITSVRDNRFFPKTGRTGTDKRKALHVHDAGSGTDTRTDNSRGKQNSGQNEERAGEGVSVGKKPQLSIDKPKQYSYEKIIKKRPAGITSPAITADAATLTGRNASVK